VSSYINNKCYLTIPLHEFLCSNSEGVRLYAYNLIHFEWKLYSSFRLDFLKAIKTGEVME